MIVRNNQTLYRSIPQIDVYGDIHELRISVRGSQSEIAITDIYVNYHRINRHQILGQ